MKIQFYLIVLLSFFGRYAFSQQPRLEVEGTAFEQSILNDGFEDGTLAPFISSIPTGNGSWIVSNIDANSGTLSATPSTNRCVSTDAKLSLAVNAPAGFTSYIRFYYKLLPGFTMELLMDNEIKFAQTSSTDWKEFNYYIGEGSHTVTWNIIDDRTCVTGSISEFGNVFIDDVKVYYQRGVVQIKDGTEGAMKVLTSDDQGHASWQDPQTVLQTLPTQCLTGLVIKNPYQTHALYENNDRGIISLYHKGSLRSQMGVANFPNHYGYLTLNGPNGNTNVQVSASGSSGSSANRGAVSLRGTTGGTRGFFYVDGNDQGALSLRNTAGSSKLFAYIANGSGRLITYGPNGNRNVTIEEYSSSGDERNRGDVIVHDKNGNTQIRLYVNNSDKGVIETDRLFAHGLSFFDAKNVQWNSVTHEFGYDNSSRRYKENITTLADDFTKILDARPVTYTRPGIPDHHEIGYIAEEMHELGLTALVEYDQEGLPDGFNYEKMITYVVEVIKLQQQEIGLLKDQVNALINE